MVEVQPTLATGPFADARKSGSLTLRAEEVILDERKFLSRRAGWLRMNARVLHLPAGGDVTFRNCAFSGFDGDLVDAICPRCGPTKAIAPFSGKGTATLEGVDLECSKCHGPIRVENAVYDIESKLLEIFTKNPPTRQQIRRFSRAIEKTKDLTAIELKAGTIGAPFQEATRLALRENDVWKALKMVAAAAVTCWAVVQGADTAISVANGADELWDKHHNGELFESFEEPDDGTATSTPSAESDEQDKAADEADDVPYGDKQEDGEQIPPTIEI
ncbi:hypothetical protein JF540_13070 [Salipiger thiooxidans]|uniref:hypothetical protein n=1 Tax=Salipiger thiooxidans TaxID=282683 RepID=UPI001A8BF43A|nr:hypothetical protein [Salipiger thiooxidans]MBN8187622.1 hypothetical protein [Salipiger thiooxidans]